MFNRLIEVTYIVVFGYAFFAVLDLGIAVRQQNLNLVGDCLSDLLWCGFTLIVLILVNRLTSPTVTVKNR